MYSTVNNGIVYLDKISVLVLLILVHVIAILPEIVRETALFKTTLAYLPLPTTAVNMKKSYFI